MIVKNMSTQGKCLHMCPPQEISMRENEKLLHPLEMLEGTEKQKYPKADPYRVVKCFSRSAAGIDLASPDILRPTSVLVKTVKYLLTFALNDSRFGSVCKYDFIVDRLRAVQQDMVIQCLSPEDSIQILEPIVKFHCLYGYSLCNEPFSRYDPVLNKNHLLEYLKRLLCCYDEVQYTNLNSCMQRLRISNESDYSVDDIITRRSLIEAIYIMSNLGDVHPLERYLQLPQVYKTGYLKTCFQVSLNYMTRNWVRVCLLMKTIPALPLCGGVLYLPNIRRTVFQVMSHAYNSKVFKYPLDNLSKLLWHEDVKDLVEECRHYNINIDGDQNISFSKDNFQYSKVFPLKRLKLIDDLLENVDIVG